jgi:enoyl-CoA hydratase
VSAAPSSPEPETISERRGRAGFVTLNRPRALNALNLTMVREISDALDKFERDPDVAFVVIAGAGERAFCAGGDIRKLYEQGRAGDHAAQRAFWREEYILDRRIKRYPKPYVALVDGVVMGGGVGLSMHGAYRIISEKAVFAMPEVGIGFFPDVGATYLMPRAPRRLGVFLVLTGLSVKAGDIFALGLATSFTPSGKFAELAEALAFSSRPLEETLKTFAAPPPASPLMAAAEWIELAFADLDMAGIRAAVDAAAGEGRPFAAEALDSLTKKSPTTRAIALRQMQLGAALTLEEALQLDFRIVSRIALGHDFYEGVRAVIVDKDNRPRWRPALGEPLPPADIDAYFAPLPEAEEIRF